MPRLTDLTDDAGVLLVPADPALDAASASMLGAAIDKLFAQFAREDRIAAWAVEPALDGALLVVAWQGELSGCSRDKLAKVLLAHERDGRRLLSAPPIVVAGAAGARCVSRAGLRQLAAADPGLRVVERVDTLGAWRTRGLRPVRESALAAIIA